MDLKGFLKLDSIYGAKLVRILYYALLIADAGSFFHGVISGIVTMAQGRRGSGLVALHNGAVPFFVNFCS